MLLLKVPQLDKPPAKSGYGIVHHFIKQRCGKQREAFISRDILMVSGWARISTNGVCGSNLCVGYCVFD
ncbi:MAG: hypothetical protein NTX48_06235 [Planctomycetales bacterium]|nr:hypothetical protein [Planctomycetales bacterium]